jgi:hypothetical protein
MLYAAKEGGRNCAVFEGIGKLDPAKIQISERKIID